MEPVLSRLAVIQYTGLMSLGVEGVLAAACGQLINADDLLLLPVHDRDQRERIGVEVGVLILLARVGGEDETLKEATVLVGGVQSAIRPRLDNDLEAGRKLELFDLLLEERRFLADFYECMEFGANVKSVKFG